MELLLDVTSSLAAATSEDGVARAITTKGITALGGVVGGLWLLDREKQLLRLVGVSPLPSGSIDRWLTIPLDVDAPMPACVRSGEPVFLDSLADYRVQFPASFERIKDTIASPDASYAMIPIVDGGPTRGGLAVTYDRANAITAADRTFLLIIARQCAMALKRIELHEAERAARLEAEEATRAREEILSVVSHDLRNPLGTILMGVTTLQQVVDPNDPKSERIRTIADRIHRQSERMARLIEDLVDFAGIQAGKLSIERRMTSPDSIVVATAELFSPVAHERGIGFTVDVAASLPQIDVDPDRAVQVLSNLLANALKVTTKGGRVAIGAVDGDDVVFFVRDSGPGIEADELPRLFERYWRSKKATYKGAGLGLSIARGIVDAHDGRIWAESQVGVGATFFFTLTRRPRI
jgi:signal transduction histidine kinase